MTLMNVIRGLIALLVCWTTAALGLGLFGIRGGVLKSKEYYLPSPAFSDAAAVGSPNGLKGEHVLVDTRTGALEPIRLKGDERWGFLSVSPWRDREGRLLAAGRWVRPHRDDSEEPLWGLGVLRLPDATVIEHTPVDPLPTGRPCWLPDSPGVILFPAADGGLYRADVELSAAAGEAQGISSEGWSNGRVGPSRVRLVSWSGKPAGESAILVHDPVVSGDRRLRRLVFAAVALPGKEGARKVFNPSRLWWLELAEDGERIVAAEPLKAPGGQPLEPADTTERFPNIAVQDGRIRLVYLARRPGDASGVLRERELELDPETGRPRVKSVAQSLAAGGDALAFGPLLVAADGKSVFALDRSGKNARLRLGAR